MASKSRLTAYFSGAGVFLLALGLFLTLSYVLNVMDDVPPGHGNLVTIHGQDKSHQIMGRRLLLSEGNYFTGIEYAKATIFNVGRLVSLPKEVDAVKWPKECASFYYKNGKTDRCLKLNVYQCTPMTNLYLPVLVYVHEGEPNLDSTANLDSDQVINNLACKGMIVVSVNYRQQIFGNYNFQKPNLAASDVKLALEWVNETIRNFNGDPSRVTVMGSRRGARIVSYLSRLPEARSLISQMILVDGASDDPGIFNQNHRFLYSQMKRLAIKANCTHGSRDLETMTKQELDDIVGCVGKLKKSAALRLDKKLIQWNPWPLDTTVLDETEDTTPMNVMLGTCYDLPVKDSKPINQSLFDTNLYKIRDIERVHDPDAFYDHYFEKYENSSIRIPDAIKQIRHDFMEVGPMLLEAHRHAGKSNSSVYMFGLEAKSTRYEYNPEVRALKSSFGKLPPCLEHLLFRRAPERDQPVQKFMSDSVANFVINGNPNEKSNTTDPRWTEFTATSTLNTYNVLTITSNGIEIRENWNTDSAKFWLCERDRARNITISSFCF